MAENELQKVEIEKPNFKIRHVLLDDEDPDKFDEKVNTFRRIIGEENIMERYYSANIMPVYLPPLVVGGDPRISKMIVAVAFFRYKDYSQQG